MAPEQESVVAGQVTALGLRNGDPAVLRALLERRGAAVLAYCEWLCAPAEAVDATADAFARFREAVMAADRPGDVDPEVALLASTRDACERITDASEEQLAAAERAYRGATGRPVAPVIVEHALTAMLAAGARRPEPVLAGEGVVRPDEPEEEPEDPNEPEVREDETPDVGEDESPDVDEDEPEEPAAFSDDDLVTVVDEPRAEAERVAEALDATQEWSLPPEDLELEVAAAQGDEDERARGAIAASGPRMTPSLPSIASLPRPHLPGRSALAPAAAVVVIATIGALVASGVFGGNDASPPLDTGIVPTRELNTIPEGEAGSVVSDLRGAADEARQQRLADKRASGALPTVEGPADTAATTTTPQDTAPAPAPEDEAAPAPEQREPPAEQEPAAEETPDTGGTAATPTTTTP